MSLTARQLSLALTILIVIMFAFTVRGILGPFVLAAVFAYVFNPVIEASARHLRLPKTLSILLIYIVLLAAAAVGLFAIGTRLLSEAKQITGPDIIDQTAQKAISALPNWEFAGQEFGPKSAAQQFVASLHAAAASFQGRVIPFFSGALREAISVLVFFLAGFYLLRDGHKMRNYVLSIIPTRNHDDFKSIWARVNVILGNYLRGQLILIVIMSVVSYMALEILGVRYALILAVATGFLEIIPFVGPVTAWAIAGSVAYLTGVNRFGLDPTTLALTVTAIYFTLRQLEDYFVIPHLYSRLTKLHPMMVIFVILAGGELFGGLGLVLAVPIAASAKVIIEYLLGNPQA